MKRLLHLPSMNADRAQNVVLAMACIALAVAAALWTWEQGRRWAMAPARASRLRDAEEAARRDPATGAELSAEVERQTLASLASVRRQRLAGIAALAAGGVGLTLVGSRRKGKPNSPAGICAIVAERRKGLSDACLGPSDESSQEPDWGLRCDATPATYETPLAQPVDLTPLEGIVARIGREPRRLIPLLHAIDRHYRYLPPAALARLPQLADVTAEQVAGVVSFYGQFRTQPRGERLYKVCVGTACHVAGADRVLDQLRQELGIPAGCDTDPAGHATVETVGCLGCCTRAPVVQEDDHAAACVHVEDVAPLVAGAKHRCDHCGNGSDMGGRGSCRAAAPRKNFTSFLKACRNRLGGSLALPNPATPAEEKPPLEIRIGLGSCCVSGGSRDVLETLQRELAFRRIDARIKPVGCVGVCHLTPLVEVHAEGCEPIVATRASTADVERIIASLPGARPWRARLKRQLRQWSPRQGRAIAAAPPAAPATLCQITPLTHDRIQSFTSPQVRIVTEHSGEMDPASLADYRRHDGFAALAECLHANAPQSIIDAVEASGLRGRGGGGFPTGRKWRIVAAAAGEKILVCNGDEGDPGAFMDRMVMESFPFRVLEGMAIAALAVGANRGIVYVRHEYPLAVERMQHAIDEMRRTGWLGERIAGGDFAFDVEIVEGAGAFVCGEETALLESIMGRRGTPQHRPPYPAERGLWDRPTLVNNVETYANIPWIIRRGAERYAALGTATSKGTKVFSLAGKVRRGGLIEVPMGLTIRQVVEEIGGGVAPGRTFKAVQIGGPSGGCLPATLGDTPIDYEALRQAGAIMGSGGLVVMDDRDCMVDVARYFLEFTQRESCGKCTFCRLGTRRLLDLLERICQGKGKPRDLDEIESLSTQVIAGSLCGLGKTAPNPVLTTLRYFRDEYEAHLAGRCPAGRCKGLIRYEVTRACVGCTICAQRCPVGAIEATPYRQHWINPDRCTRCDVCRTACPELAIEVR